MNPDLRRAVSSTVRAFRRRLRRALSPDPERSGAATSRADEHPPRADKRPAQQDGNARGATETPSITVSEVESAAERLTYSPGVSGDDVDLLVSALDAPDPDVRIHAMKSIAGLPAPALAAATGAVPGLVESLDGEADTLRRNAARALARVAEVDPDRVVAAAPRIAEHVDAYNVWISEHAAAALAEAAASAPEEVAPLVFEHVDATARHATRRHALSVLARAADASPDAIEPVVTTLVDLLEAGDSASPAVVRTLSAVAGEYPDLVAPAASRIATYAAGGSGETAEAAIRALSRLGLAAPSTARPAVPALAGYLAGVDPPHADLAASALVAVVDRHPEERQVVSRVLGGREEAGQLRAVRTLSALEDDAGAELIEAIRAGGSLDRYRGT